MKGIGNAAGLPASKLSGLTTLANNTAAGFGEIATQASLAAGAAAAAIGGAVALSISQESAFAGVKKTIDATPEGFEKIRTELRALSEAIPVSFEKLSGISEIGGQLGIAEANIATFTDTIARLGEASNLVGEEGATALARFINVTDATQEEVSNLASVIVALGNNGATTEAEIATMATRIGLSGTTAGLASFEILAFSEALSSAGIGAELGGTNFSKFADTLNTAVIQGGSDLAGFAKVAGTSAEAFATAFRDDAAGAIQDFAKGLNEFEKGNGDVATLLDDLGIKGQEAQKVVRALATRHDELGKSLQRAGTEFVANTALFDESNKRFETTASQLQIVKNAFANLGADIGTAFIPSITAAVGIVTGAIADLRAFGESLNLNSTRVADFSLAIVAIGAVLAPIVAVVATLTAVFGAVSAPVLAIIAVVGVAAGALFAFREEIAQAAVGFNVWLSDILGVTDVFQIVKDTLSNTITIITDFAIAVFEASPFGVLLEQAGKLFEFFRSKGEAALNDQAAAMEKVGDKAEDAAKKIEKVEKETNGANTATNTFKGTLGSTKTKIEEYSRATAKLANLDLPTLDDKINAAAQSIRDKDAATKALDASLKTLASAGMRDATSGASDLKAEIDKTILKFPISATAGQDAFAAIAGAVPSVTQILGTIPTETQAVVDAFGSLQSKSIDELVKLKDEAAANFQLIESSGKATPENLTEAWRNQLQTTKDLLVAQGTDLTTEQQKTLDDLNAALENGLGSSGGMREKWANFSTDVGAIIGDMATNLTADLFEGNFSVSTVTNALTAIKDAFINAFITPLTTALGEFVTNALNPVTSGISGLLGGGSAVAGTASNAAIDAASAAANGGTAAANAAGTAASTGSSAAGSAASSAGGLLNTVDVVSGAVTAVSSVFSNFQFAAMNKSLDLIETQVRRTAQFLGDRGDGGIIATQFRIIEALNFGTFVKVLEEMRDFNNGFLTTKLDAIFGELAFGPNVKANERSADTLSQILSVLQSGIAVTAGTGGGGMTIEEAVAQGVKGGSSPGRGDSGIFAPAGTTPSPIEPVSTPGRSRSSGSQIVEQNVMISVDASGTSSMPAEEQERIAKFIGAQVASALDEQGDRVVRRNLAPAMKNAINNNTDGIRGDIARVLPGGRG